MAISMGIGFMTQFFNPNRPFEAMSLTATIFTTIAGVTTIAACVYGSLTIAKDKGALFTAVLTYLSGIILLSCAFTPILHSAASVFIGLVVTAGIIDVLAGTVFLTYFVLGNKKSSGNNIQQGAAQQLKLLEKLYNKELLTEEEYAAKKESVLCSLTDVQQTEQDVRTTASKKPLLKSVALGAAVAVYCVVAFPIISTVYKSNVYDYIEDTISNYSKEYLDDYLDYLPNNYNDIRSIKNTYKDVQYYLYDNRVEDLRRYVELDKIQEKDSHWNFEKIFADISWFDIYGVKWEGDIISLSNSSSGNGSGVTQLTGEAYIQITNDQGKETFYTNLPNNKVSGKSYYFYKEFKSNYVIIGYENQNDTNDRFDAFKISDIKYNSKTNLYSLNVFCYSNSKTYVLQYQYV